MSAEPQRADPLPLPLPIHDPCYGLYYLPDDDPFMVARLDGPFSVPDSILREMLLERWTDTSGRLNQPIDFGFAGTGSPLHVTSSLLHVFGTWHFAEQCLSFGRVKFPEGIYRGGMLPADTPTLATKLRYGDGDLDTLVEEFGLAAFFQAYLGPDVTGETIERHLKENKAFQRYQSPATPPSSIPIQVPIIAYWAAGGNGDPPALDGDASSQAADLLSWLKKLFFADNAPLNLHHLDILARIYHAHLWHSEKPLGFNRTVRAFLNRIRIEPRRPGDVHLLPDESPWADLCPYYVPHPDDNPTYCHLMPFLKALELVRTVSANAGKKPLHSIFHAFSGESEGETGVGLLRLSFLHQRKLNVSARFIHRYLAKVTAG